MERSRNDELLTIKEAAALLKMSVVTVRRWLKQGRLVGYRVGPRSIRLRRCDVEVLLESTHVEETIERESRSLSDAEVAQLEEAIRRSDELRERIYREHGGKPMPSSIDLISEDRERDSFVRKLPPLTDEEAAQQVNILEQADRLRAEMRRARGGRLMPSSVDLIREEREKRSFDA
jgi:excisionase family DNA binding protein